MSDFNISRILGSNPITKTEGTSRSASPAPAGGPSFLGQGTGVDSFTRSNPLGTAQDSTAASAVKNIQGKSIAELTQGWNPSTVKTLQSAPQNFPTN